MATIDDLLALIGAKEVQILELNRRIQELESEDKSTNDEPNTDKE